MVVNGRVPVNEVGTTGVVRFGGRIDDEQLSDLRGPRRVKTIRQMTMNDATIGAGIFAIKMMIRQVDWSVPPTSPATHDVEAADLIDSALNDMSSSWKSTVSDIVSFLPWGYSWHELVYKHRDGPDTDDPTRKSKYRDGKVGWRKMPIRRQETHYDWIFDESGGVQAFVQRAAPDYQLRILPIERALLFQTEGAGGNPEGYSILRNCYRPWRMKTDLENLEGVAIERDSTGLPVGTLPSAYMTDSATPEQKQIYGALQDIITGLRLDEQMGALWPSDRDSDGNLLFDLRLLSAAGTRQININEAISRYDQRMLMSMMADFLLLGSGDVGSLALSTDKTDLWAIAINTWADSIADVVNQHAIPRLLRYNGIRVSDPPQLTHNRIKKVDIGSLGDFLQKALGSGVLTYDPGLEAYVREAAELPELPDDLVTVEGRDQ